MTEPARFPVLFTGANKAMAVLGLTPGTSFVEVDQDSVRVRMGWTYSLTFPRSHVQSVEDDTDPVRGWGVHGYGGKWLVNGSSSGIVRITLDPPGQGRLVGLPRSWTKVQVLRVAVEDPDGLKQALATD